MTTNEIDKICDYTTKYNEMNRKYGDKLHCTQKNRLRISKRKQCDIRIS